MVSLERLVLLSGPVAVGKTTLREVLMSSCGFDHVRSSGYLKQLAAERGVESGRTSLQDLGDELDRETDYLWLLERVARPGFAAAPAQRRWLIDAVRKQRQVEHFKAAYTDVVLHVHLTASEGILRQRYAQRHDVTPYDVVIQHENEVASRGLIAIADLVVDTGDTTAEDAARQVMRQMQL